MGVNAILPCPKCREHTSSGNFVGSGTGSDVTTVVVEILVDVLRNVEVVVAVKVVVVVTVWLSSSPPCPKPSLCCAPANRPIKT